MRSKALKYIQSFSNHSSATIDLYSSVAYLAYSVEADASGSVSQSSRRSLSPSKYEKDDQIWILKQDSTGVLVGKYVFPPATAHIIALVIFDFSFSTQVHALCP